MTDEAKLIIAGLRYCTTHDLCDGCPAKHICIDTGPLIETHAAEMIEMQEQALDRLEKLYKDTLAELEKVQCERDAAVKDMECIAESSERCEVCKKRLVGSGKCPELGACPKCCGWEWRGPKEESPDEIPR